MEQIILNGLTKDELGEIISQSVAKAINSKSSEKEQKDLEVSFLGRKEVAKLLKISLPTLNEWTKFGLLISYRIGTRILYKLNEIEEAIKQRQFKKFRKEKNHE